MNQKNYTTLETSKRLKELGVLQKSDSSWFGDEKIFNEEKTKVVKYVWITTTIPVNWLDTEHRNDIDCSVPICSAFNASELVALHGGFGRTLWDDNYNQHSVIDFPHDNADVDDTDDKWENPEYVAEQLAYLLLIRVRDKLDSVEEINKRYTKYLEQ